GAPYKRPKADAGNPTAPAKESHPACTARITAGRVSSAEREPPRPSADRRPWSVSGAFRTSGSCSARSNDWCAHPSAMLHGCQEPRNQREEKIDELTLIRK